MPIKFSPESAFIVVEKNPECPGGPDVCVCAMFPEDVAFILTFVPVDTCELSELKTYP